MRQHACRLLVCIAAVVASCGGGDSGSESDTTVEEDVTSTTDTSVTSDVTTATDAADVPTTSDASTTGDGDAATSDDVDSTTTTDVTDTEVTTTDVTDTEVTTTDVADTEVTTTDVTDTEVTTTDVIDTDTADVTITDVVTTDGDAVSEVTTTEVTVTETVDDASDDADTVDVCTSASRPDGCACEDDGDCASGLCLDGAVGSYCQHRCDGNEDCADDTTCVIAAGQSQGVCLVDEDYACVPCAADAECRRAGGDAACRQVGTQGTFCVLPCDAGNPCFEGYTCTAGYCQPSDSTCECTEVAVEIEAATKCAVTNGFGTCEALRSCNADLTLQACTAPTPKAETCDGVDNDCKPATVESGALCNDDDPCTSDVCDGANGCKHPPLSTGACDDGNPCTSDDTCQAGECVGTDSCPCENPAIDCTTPPDGQVMACLTASCSAQGTCVFTPKSGGCTDGDACTAGDACQAGACVGSDVDCDDDDACTTDSCDAATGCKNDEYRGACEDGDPCTTEDTCATGECVGETLDCSGLDDACHIGVCDGVGGCVAQTAQCGVSRVRYHMPSAAITRAGSGATWIRGSVGHGGPTGSGATAVRKVQFGFHPGMHR